MHVGLLGVAFCLSVCLPACLPVCLPACLPACLPVCLSVCLSVWLCALPCGSTTMLCTNNLCCAPYKSIVFLWFTMDMQIKVHNVVLYQHTLCTKGQKGNVKH